MGSYFFSSIQAQILFDDNRQNLTSSQRWNIHLLDIESDGDLDAYFENYSWLNDSKGFFEKTDYTFTQANFPIFADMNGDELVDVIAQDSIFINDGHFNFNFSKVLMSDIPMSAAVVTDIDNNNDLDIISCSSDPDRILINDEEGNFSSTKKSLVVGDILLMH